VGISLAGATSLLGRWGVANAELWRGRLASPAFTTSGVVD